MSARCRGAFHRAKKYSRHHCSADSTMRQTHRTSFKQLLYNGTAFTFSCSPSPLICQNGNVSVSPPRM